MALTLEKLLKVKKILDENEPPRQKRLWMVNRLQYVVFLIDEGFSGEEIIDKLNVVFGDAEVIFMRTNPKRERK